MIETAWNARSGSQLPSHSWDIKRTMAVEARKQAIELEAEADRDEREWKDREKIDAMLTAEYGPVRRK